MKKSQLPEERYTQLITRLIDRRTELAALRDKMCEHALSEFGSEASGDLSHIRLHPADEASDVAEQTTDLEICARETEEIAQIDRALARAHQGLFGQCESCGEEIPFERLMAVPESLKCVACAEFASDRKGAIWVKDTLHLQPLACAEEDRNDEIKREEDIERALSFVQTEPEVEEIERSP